MKTVLFTPSAAVGYEILMQYDLDEVLPIADGNREALRSELTSADAVVCNDLTPSDVADAAQLQLVQLLSAGIDGFDLTAVPESATLCNIHDHETAISEWALMGMLALSRRLLTYDHDLRAGEWHNAVWFVGTPDSELFGKTLGVIGLGHIGTRTAELARALGMTTIAVTRTPSPERQSKHELKWLDGIDALPRLLDEADFVLISLPLTPETDGLIGETELKAIGPTGYLLNPARGAIVDENALFRALSDRTIAGAALDAWYRYPSSLGESAMPASLPFWTLDNVVMTPHAAGWSQGTVERRWNTVGEQLTRLRAGTRLHSIVREPAHQR
jgi:phosphoglycerate dehydrogenase-like enzyme